MVVKQAGRIPVSSVVGTVTAKLLGRERHFALLQPGILS